MKYKYWKLRGSYFQAESNWYLRNILKQTNPTQEDSPKQMSQSIKIIYLVRLGNIKQPV